MKKYDIEIGFCSTTGLISVATEEREAVQEMLDKLPYIDRTYLGIDKTKIGLFISALAEPGDFAEIGAKVAEIVTAE